jgi:hypothetical protein
MCYSDCEHHGGSVTKELSLEVRQARMKKDLEKSHRPEVLAFFFMEIIRLLPRWVKSLVRAGWA